MRNEWGGMRGLGSHEMWQSELVDVESVAFLPKALEFRRRAMFCEDCLEIKIEFGRWWSG